MRAVSFSTGQSYLRIISSIRIEPDLLTSFEKRGLMDRETRQAELGVAVLVGTRAAHQSQSHLGDGAARHMSHARRSTLIKFFKFF